MLLAQELLGIKGRILENVGQDIDRQWKVLGQYACIIVGVFDAGRSVQFAAHGFNFFSNRSGIAGFCPLKAICSKRCVMPF